jgi:hypothetical protein
MFGHLKTIKVWVAWTPGYHKIKLIDLNGAKKLSEFEGVTVFAQVGKIPRNKMAHMNATIVFWSKIPGKWAGVEIIHVFANRYIW